MGNSFSSNRKRKEGSSSDEREDRVVEGSSEDQVYADEADLSKGQKKATRSSTRQSGQKRKSDKTTEASQPSDAELEAAIRGLLPQLDLHETGIKSFTKLLSKELGGADLNSRNAIIKDILTDAINEMPLDEIERLEEGAEKRKQDKATVPHREKGDTSPLPHVYLPTQEKDVFLFLIQAITQFYASLHDPDLTRNLEALILKNLKEYPNLAYAAFALEDGEELTLDGTFLLETLTIQSMGATEECLPHRAMKKLIEMNPESLRWDFLLIDPSVRDAIAEYHEELVPWIEEHYLSFYKTQFKKGDCVLVCSFYKTQLKKGERVLVCPEKSERKGTVLASRKGKGKVKIKFDDGKTSWISRQDHDIRFIDPAASPQKQRKDDDDDSKKPPAKETFGSQSPAVSDDDLEKLPPQRPFISHEDTSDYAQQVLAFCFEKIFHVFLPEYRPQLGFNCGQLMSMLKNCFDDAPELEQVVALDMRGWSILSAVCVNDGTGTGDSQECLKFIIRRNPCLLFWNVEKETEELGDDDSERTIDMTTLECICLTHPELFFWIVKELPWIWNHPLAYVPSLLGSLVRSYHRGVLPARRLQDFFQEYPHLMHRYLVTPDGDRWDYPVHFCVLSMAVDGSWNGDPNNPEVMKWLIQKHSDHLSSLPPSEKQENDSILHLLCRVLGREDDAAAERIKRTMPYWKMIVEKNPFLVINRNDNDSLPVEYLIPNEHFSVVESMIGIMERTRAHLATIELGDVESTTLKNNALLLEESATSDSNKSRLLEDVHGIFCSWKNSRKQDLDEVVKRGRKAMKKDIDELVFAEEEL